MSAVKNRLGHPLDIARRIEIGDRVRIQFDGDKNDLIGDVIYIPTQPGDVWIVVSENNRKGKIQDGEMIMILITLSKPITLNIRREHLPENDPAYNFSTETRALYAEGNYQTNDKTGMVEIHCTAYVPAKSENGTPYQLKGLGGNQNIKFRESLIIAIAPAD